jgi:hypothetical protein
MIEQKQQAKLAPEGVVETVAVALGQGLLNQIGARLVVQVFPPSMPSYFDQVYKQITKIVRQALLENTIDIINGEIDGTQMWVKTIYEVHKNNGTWSKGKLINELQKTIDGLWHKVIGVLKQPSYAGAGYPVFMVAGGLQLALAQEQSLVDPKAPAPSASGYTLSLYAMAAAHYDYAFQAFIGILRDRVNSVKVEKMRVDRPQYVGAPTVQRWLWRDRVLDKTKEFSSEEAAHTAMKAHVVRVCDELVENLKYPMTTAMNWLSLTRNNTVPLYTCHTTNINGYFFDYSNAQNYVNRVGVHEWTQTENKGICGWMGAKDKDKGHPGADIPVYRLLAAKDSSRVLIVFSKNSFTEAKAAGWSGEGEGKGLLGHLWQDPSKIPMGRALPVYPLSAQGKNLTRTKLATTLEDYEFAQKWGWDRVGSGGLVGYLCGEA